MQKFYVARIGSTNLVAEISAESLEDAQDEAAERWNGVYVGYADEYYDDVDPE